MTHLCSSQVRAGAAVCALATALLASSSRAEPLPPSLVAVIDAAAATGKPETLKTVVDLIKTTNPASIAEIDAQVASLKGTAEKARAEKLARQGPFEGIKGEGQIGFSNSTGESKTVSLAVGLKLSKETLNWTHSLTLNADYEWENGVTSEERYFAGYDGRYKITRRQYIYDALSWERDPFSGFSSRFAGSVGLGYKLIDRPTISLSLDTGPAVRRIAYLAVPGEAAYSQNEAMGRVGEALSWTIVPRVVLSETTTGYFGSGDESFMSVVALTTKVEGAVSGRLSYEVDYDSLLPPGYNNFETLGRFTLVYGF